jgi:hypothetical protein
MKQLKEHNIMPTPPSPNALLNQIAKTSTSMEDFNDTLEGIMKATEALTKDARGDIERRAQLETDTAQAQLNRRLEVESGARKITAVTGVDPNAEGEIYTALGEEFKAAIAQRQQLGVQLQQDLSVSFMDDPLSWLSSQVTQADTKAAFEVANARANSAAQSIQQANSINEGSYRAAAEASKTLDSASAEKYHQLTAIEANLKARGAQLETYKQDVASIAAVVSGKQTLINNAMNAWQVQSQDYHNQVAVSRLALEQEAKKDEQKYATTLITLYNDGAAALDLPPIKTMADLKVLEQLNKPRLDYIMQRGALLKTAKRIPTVDKDGNVITAPDRNGLYGADFAEAYIGSRMSGRDLTKSPVLSFMDKIYASLSNDKTLNWGGLKQPERNIKLNERVTTELETERNRPEKSELFKAPSLQVLAALPQVQATPLYKTVLAPLVAAGTIDSSTEFLSSLGRDAVDKNVLSMDDVAKSLAVIYKTAGDYNTATKDFKSFNIAPQNTYKTKADVGFGSNIGAPVKVDWTKPEEIKLLLMVNRRKSLVEIFSGLGNLYTTPSK